MTQRLNYHPALRNITHAHAAHAINTIYLAGDKTAPVADVYMAADATERLVAAWNVCDGVDTESLRLMDAGALARELRRWPVLHDAVFSAQAALDLMASRCIPGVGMAEAFNDVCELTGVTAKLAAAILFEDAPDERGWRPSHGRQADAEGWGIFNENQIHRDDEADAFASDADAVAFIRSCARRGSEVHAVALRICGIPHA